MVITSVATKLTIDVTCRYAGHDWPALVANNLYLNGFHFKMAGKTLEVEDIPSVLEQMDSFLSFREYNYYGVDALIDGRGEFWFSVRDRHKESSEPEPYEDGHFLGVFRPREAEILWKPEDDYTSAWMQYAMTYLVGGECEVPELHPESSACAEDVFDEMLRLLTIESLNIEYTEE